MTQFIVACAACGARKVEREPTFTVDQPGCSGEFTLCKACWSEGANNDDWNDAITLRIMARRDRTESEIQNGILERFGREPDVTLWRNNAGVAQSTVVTRAHLERLLSFIASQGRINDACALIKSLLDERPRFTPYGLCVGSSDIIGIVQAPAYRDHMGDPAGFHRGITLALEVKKPGRKPTKEQQLFLDLVNRRGGVGECVHSEDEAQAAIDRARAL